MRIKFIHFLCGYQQSSVSMNTSFLATRAKQANYVMSHIIVYATFQPGAQKPTKQWLKCYLFYSPNMTAKLYYLYSTLYAKVSKNPHTAGFGSKVLKSSPRDNEALHAGFGKHRCVETHEAGHGDKYNEY